MNAVMFEKMQRSFAQRLRRLGDLPYHPKSGNFSVDEVAGTIDSLVDGNEDITDIIVHHIPQNDRRLREVMVSINHVLADVPSALLFGSPNPTDQCRIARYELVALLMVNSGFLVELLDDTARFQTVRFTPASNFFQARQVAQLNEQKISCMARRLLCFYGPITSERVPNRELRDNLARSNSGMTTENLLQKELGPVKFRTWHVPQLPDDAWLGRARGAARPGVTTASVMALTRGEE